MKRTSAIMAIIVGLAVAGLTVWLQALEPNLWETFLVGYAIAAALLLGGIRVLQEAAGGLRLLAAAWGATCGVAGLGAFALLAPTSLLSEPVEPPGPYDAHIAFGVLALSIVLAAMTVLHREQKR